MKLQQLFHGVHVLETVHWLPNRPIHKIASDSRAVEPGDLFVACRGSRMDGHDFLLEAIHDRAAVIVCEHIPDIVIPPHVSVAVVANSQACLAEILNRFYDFPDRHIKLLGVTGTNGKTTIAYVLQKLLSAKARASYLGTLYYETPSRHLPSLNTTPGPEVLIPLLDHMRRERVQYCCLEVSSHALDQQRVHGLQFETALFTQLTQDHLDYHKNFESYFQTKRKLFVSDPMPKHRLINHDCPYGRRLQQELGGAAASFSITEPADYYATDIETSFAGSRFQFCYRGGKVPFEIQLPMHHNVSNAVAILATLDQLGFHVEDFRERLAEIKGLPGRLERVEEAEDYHVFVDYAHTPDAFEHVLGEARRLASRRVITVFGCGGDRDQGKRPLMTAAACRFSDVVVLTSDNPRSEDPEEIMNGMKRGIPAGDSHRPLIFEITDRREAIERAMAMAEPDDVVLILGKGHENYQILGERKIPFDDRETAKEFAKRKTRVFLS